MTYFKNRLIAAFLHLSLVIAVTLFTWWELSAIYQQDSLWFPVMKSSVIVLFVVYLNIYLLAPQLILKRNWYWVYLLAVLYIAMLVYVIEMRINDMVYLKYTTKIRELYGKVEINPLLQVITSVISLIILMISSSAVVFFREWSKHDIRVHDLEKKAMLMELEQLKKQVKPQYLVRTLDKVNELSQQGKRNEATTLLLKLSDRLRHQLYST